VVVVVVVAVLVVVVAAVVEVVVVVEDVLLQPTRKDSDIAKAITKRKIVFFMSYLLDSV